MTGKFWTHKKPRAASLSCSVTQWFYQSSLWACHLGTVLPTCFAGSCQWRKMWAHQSLQNLLLYRYKPINNSARPHLRSPPGSLCCLVLSVKLWYSPCYSKIYCFLLTLSSLLYRYPFIPIRCLQSHFISSLPRLVPFLYFLHASELNRLFLVCCKKERNKIILVELILNLLTHDFWLAHFLRVK